MHFFVTISSLHADRLETANRQLSSRDYDGHEDRAAEGLYASQSESPTFTCPDIGILKNWGPVERILQVLSRFVSRSLASGSFI